MATVTVETTDNRYVSGTYNWVQIVLLGMALGVVVWALTWLFGQFIIEPLLCRESATQACGRTTEVAGNLAAVAGAMIGLGALIRLRVLRPLLAVVASLVVLWGLALWTAGMHWAEAAAWSAGLYALSYTLFVWLARFRRIGLVLITLIVIVLIARIIVSL